MKYADIFLPAKVLLPKNADLHRYAVIAVDQYTSDAAYWQRVEQTVGDAPSALRMVLPEIYLDAPDKEARIAAVTKTMERYLADGTLRELPERFIYVGRTLPDGKIRRGLVGRVDLEAYDYLPGAKTPVRVTEGTILERIPPRLAVRQNAALELPHALLLIDDPGKTVIEPLTALRRHMEKLYDFDLMEGGGHLRGYLVPEDAQGDILDTLEAFAEPESFADRYDVSEKEPLLQIAVGDGNHSLATARAHYLAVTKGLSEAERLAHPARWALAELENLHDDSLEFEAIHRVVFDTDPHGLLNDMLAYFTGSSSTPIRKGCWTPCGRSTPAPWSPMPRSRDRCALPARPPREKPSSPFRTRRPSSPWAPCSASWTITCPPTPAASTTSTARTRSGLSGGSPALSPSSSPPWARTSCSPPSSTTASCPARPSPWAKRPPSGTTWRPGKSDNRECLS